MEIEAKFLVLKPETLQTLREQGRVGAYTVLESTMRHIHDTYLDTQARHLLAAGYALRQREETRDAPTGPPTLKMSLKSLTPAEGSTHRREEIELVLPHPAPPEQWPEGALRQRVLDITGGAPLDVLFELHQRREARAVHRGAAHVATMSLDEVEIRGQHHTELEIELQDEGSEADLQALVDALARYEGLVPESRSKFERGLALAHVASPEAPS